MNIKTVLVIGAGTMGQMIAQLCAEYGYRVHIYDVSEDALANAAKRISKRLGRKTATGEMAPEEEDKVLNLITCHTDAAEAAQNVDIVSESVPEDPEMKGKIFYTFHELCSPDTIFTTNTSSLLPSQFADASGRPEKLCAFHFHDTRITKIVDVMPHDKTSLDVVETVTQFARSIGQVPIVLTKENNGYVFNSMLMSFLSAALTLAARNVTSIEEIDKSWMGVMLTGAGPFGIMDSIGLDTVYKVTSYWAEKRGDQQAKANAAFLKKYVDQGKTGVKAGAGFYNYPDAAYLSPDFLK